MPVCSRCKRDVSLSKREYVDEKGVKYCWNCALALNKINLFEWVDGETVSEKFRNEIFAKYRKKQEV